MREVLHELRTPANAIQVAAEIIQQQLYGPAPHEYRALAAAIAGDTAQILAGFDELDRLARLESGALSTAGGTCDLGALVIETVTRLRAWTAPRESGFSLSAEAPEAMAAMDHVEAARLVWRLLAAIAGLSARGEVSRLAFASDAGTVSLVIDLPGAVAERLEQTDGPDRTPELARSLRDRLHHAARGGGSGGRRRAAFPRWGAHHARPSRLDPCLGKPYASLGIKTVNLSGLRRMAGSGPARQRGNSRCQARTSLSDRSRPTS
jgi:hypothetical protein